MVQSEADAAEDAPEAEPNAERQQDFDTARAATAAVVLHECVVVQNAPITNSSTATDRVFPVVPDNEALLLLLLGVKCALLNFQFRDQSRDAIEGLRIAGGPVIRVPALA